MRVQANEIAAADRLAKLGDRHSREDVQGQARADSGYRVEKLEERPFGCVGEAEELERVVAQVGDDQQIDLAALAGKRRQRLRGRVDLITDAGDVDDHLLRRPVTKPSS